MVLKTIDNNYFDDNLLQLYLKNEPNYSEIIKNSEYNLVNNQNIDISIIIPIMNRSNQVIPLVNNLKEAIYHHNKKKYSITFIEHDTEPKNKDLITSMECNYIFINRPLTQEFNKCLAMNVGALLVDGKHFLFHDVDILVKQDFFKNIFLNLERIGTDSVIHPFSNRRVIYLNDEKSNMVRDKTLNVNDIVNITPYNPSNPKEIMYGKVGAPGGSILIKNDLFYLIGGYDESFFSGYSPEDYFFWLKIEVIKKINSCDDPKNEVFHLHHDSVHRRPSKQYEIIVDKFNNSNIDKKMEYIKIKSKNLKNGKFT